MTDLARACRDSRADPGAAPGRPAPALPAAWPESAALPAPVALPEIARRFGERLAAHIERP